MNGEGLDLPTYFSDKILSRIYFSGSLGQYPSMYTAFIELTL